MSIKTCNVCNVEKDVSNFYYRKENGKYRANCKKCKPVKNRLWLATRTSKICTHCNIDKPLTDYQKAGRGKWHQPYCKECDSERKKKYNIENEAKVKERSKKYHEENRAEILTKNKIAYKRDKEKILRYQENYRLNNSDYIKKREKKYRLLNGEILNQKTKEWYYKNRERNLLKAKEKRVNKTPEQRLKDAEYQKQWKIKNEEHIQEYKKANIEKRREIKRIYCNAKSATDITFKILKNLRSRTRFALKKNVKSDTTENLLGCTIVFFQNYFESLFIDGMTWELFMQGEIHIDHKIPCKLFDLSKEDEQKKCFHYTNLQPLFKEDNLKKGTKVNYQITNQCSIQSQKVA